MKIVISILAALVILFSQSVSTVVYLNWSWHKKELVKSCCVQKNEANNTCQGSCCLKKQMEKTTNKREFNFSIPRLSWTVPFPEVISFCQVISQGANYHSVYIAGFSDQHLIGLIKPPSV